MNDCWRVVYAFLDIPSAMSFRTVCKNFLSNFPKLPDDEDLRDKLLSINKRLRSLSFAGACAMKGYNHLYFECGGKASPEMVCVGSSLEIAKTINIRPSEDLVYLCVKYDSMEIYDLYLRDVRITNHRIYGLPMRSWFPIPNNVYSEELLTEAIENKNITIIDRCRSYATWDHVIDAKYLKGTKLYSKLVLIASMRKIPNIDEIIRLDHVGLLSYREYNLNTVISAAFYHNSINILNYLLPNYTGIDTIMTNNISINSLVVSRIIEDGYPLDVLLNVEKEITPRITKINILALEFIYANFPTWLTPANSYSILSRQPEYTNWFLDRKIRIDFRFLLACQHDIPRLAKKENANYNAIRKAIESDAYKVTKYLIGISCYTYEDFGL